MQFPDPHQTAPIPSDIRRIDFQTPSGPNTIWIGGSWGTGSIRHHLVMRASQPAPKRKQRAAPESAERDSASAEVPLSDKWITPALLAYTRQVWTEHYGREVSAAEAIEMLGNVRAYAKVMLEAQAAMEAKS